MGMSWVPVLGTQTQPLMSRAAVVGQLSEPLLGGARESPQPPGSTRRIVCPRDVPVSQASSLTQRTSAVRTVTEVPKITTRPGAWALRTRGQRLPAAGHAEVVGVSCSRASTRRTPVVPQQPVLATDTTPGIADAPGGRIPAQEALGAAGAPGQEAMGPQPAHPGKSSWVTGPHLHGTHSGARSLWSPSGASRAP